MEVVEIDKLPGKEGRCNGVFTQISDWILSYFLVRTLDDHLVLTNAGLSIEISAVRQNSFSGLFMAAGRPANSQEKCSSKKYWTSGKTAWS